MKKANRMVCTAAAGLLLAASAARGAGSITVTNLKNGEVLRYSTPLLVGTLTDQTATTITLINASSQRPTREMTGLAHKGRFKVLADLVPGENKLTLRAGKGGMPVNFTLNFKLQTNPFLVRAVYYTDKTGDAGFLSPVKNDKQDVRGKLSTAMLLMQSFTAEEMNRYGYGRKTFNVDLQPDGTVKAFIIKGNQEPNSGLNGGALDEAIGSQAARGETIYLVILGRGCGYTAVGGGGKALFGGSCIYSWPDTMRGAQAAFMDATPIDTDKYHADAIGRDVFWANSSTCIGACLHEIYHTMYLPHSMDARCIMTRGHDYFNRFFTLVEPPSKQNSSTVEFGDDTARLCKVSANNLAPSKYLTLDKKDYSEPSEVKISYDSKKNEITVESRVGIIFVGLEVPYANPGADYCLTIDPAKPLPKKITIPAKEWERFGGGQFQVRVIDANDGGTTDRDPLRGQYGPRK